MRDSKVQHQWTNGSAVLHVAAFEINCASNLGPLVSLREAQSECQPHAILSGCKACVSPMKNTCSVWKIQGSLGAIASWKRGCHQPTRSLIPLRHPSAAELAHSLPSLGWWLPGSSVNLDKYIVLYVCAPLWIGFNCTHARTEQALTCKMITYAQ